MSNRFSCALNDMPMEELDPAIRVTDLTELPPRMRTAAVPAVGHGLRLLRRVRESLTVRISFIIHEYDPIRRREVLQLIHEWAEGGGWLTVSDRPGLKLRVVCDALPTMSALCWADEMQLVLTAYETPFWVTEEEAETVTDSFDLLTLPGTARECPVNVEVTNVGDDVMTSLYLQCGETEMTFEGLEVQPWDMLTLTCEDGPVQAEAYGESILMHRTGESSDLLLASCGEDTMISVAADQPVEARFYGRGRVL